MSDERKSPRTDAGDRADQVSAEPAEHVTRDDQPHSAVAEHVEECVECAQDPRAMAQVDALLARSIVSVDSRALARTAFERTRVVVAEQAARAYRRRVAAVLAVALLPLPAVLAYQAYLVRNAYELLCDLLPSGIAAYLVIGYAASLVLVFAGTYAAIPLLCARSSAGRRDRMAGALG